MGKTKDITLLDWVQDTQHYKIERESDGFYKMVITAYGQEQGLTHIRSQGRIFLTKSELIEMLDKFASVRDDLNGADKE